MRLPLLGALTLAVGLGSLAFTGTTEAQQGWYGRGAYGRAGGMRRLERHFDRAQDHLGNAIDRVAALRRMSRFTGDVVGNRLGREVRVLSRELGELDAQLDVMQRMTERRGFGEGVLRGLERSEQQVRRARSLVNQLERRMAGGFVQPQVFRALVADIEQALLPAGGSLDRVGARLGFSSRFRR